MQILLVNPYSHSNLSGYRTTISLDQYKQHILSRVMIHQAPQSEGQPLKIKKEH